MLINPGVGVELFHTATGTTFADLVISGHRETWPIRSKRFRNWLRHHHYRATVEAPSAQAIRAALDLLEARAQFDGPERAVHIRIAEHAGCIYLDLADERDPPGRLRQQLGGRRRSQRPGPSVGLQSTLGRVFRGFGLAALVGVPFGLLIGAWRPG